MAGLMAFWLDAGQTARSLGRFLLTNLSEDEDTTVSLRTGHLAKQSDC